ncbi:hypothetical protein [Microcoleus sp. bin38.metabat.b11b12b14.051]|uniref:hypothetical protein n=1 Tax=Microcoleus sp. bin38.metabat.b11b12b14.051 TaxID=2742709 RepID=UPI0025D653B2|nr:hypothetical protein [Microcoleus sp. bin38.metabat.b11b12b14.051]
MTDPYTLFEEARKQQPNPFRLKPIVSANEVWGEVVTNLADLNQQVDTTIYKAISEVRQKYSDKIGIAIRGDRGTGKSHTIHRIWKTIERDGGAVFAYIPQFTNASRIDSHVRFHLSLSFKHQDVRGVTQWQQLAASMIATLRGTEFEEKYQPYLEKCNHPEELRKYLIQNLNQEQRFQFIDEVIEAILEYQHDLDFNFLRAVLFLLFKTAPIAQIGMAWIQGIDHPETRQRGLPEFSQQEQDSKSIWFIEQICKLAGVSSRPVLICFDQLDQVSVGNDCGDSAAQIVASCIDRIYFQCSNVLLLCCVISDTWREIELMGSGIPDRVGQWSVATNPPTADQMLELVKLRLCWFHSKNNLNYDDYQNLYPFDATEISGIASRAAGVRDLMKWCAEKFDSMEIVDPLTAIIDPLDNKRQEFVAAYKELLIRVSVPDKNDEQLATIIACTMRMIPNGGTENVIITSVTHIKQTGHDLHLIVDGYDSLQQKVVKIGVRVSETQTGRTFNAVMERLLKYTKHNITRGCLVRSTPVPLSWKKGKQLENKLVQQQGGEVVVLKKDEIKPLAALHQIYEEAENYGFTKQEVIEFVKELNLAGENLLLCEILSAPT